MAHARQTIREAAATALTGLTTTGSRVYQSRVHPVSDAKLPCLLINTDSESVVAENVGSPALLDRFVELSVRCVAKASSNLDDTLDAMAAEVEAAIGASTLSGKLKTLLLESIDVEMVGEAEKPVGILTMKWRANYMTVSNAPTVII